MSLSEGGGKLITLYSTDCPKCKILKTKLSQKGIEYQEFTNVDEMLEKGMTTVPWLEVNGELMNFVKANEWVNQQ